VEKDYGVAGGIIISRTQMNTDEHGCRRTQGRLPLGYTDGFCLDWLSFLSVCIGVRFSHPCYELLTHRILASI